MSINIVFTAHRRAPYLRRSLESWARVRGIENTEIDIFLDPSDRQSEMLRVMEESTLNITIHENTHKHGVLGNPWRALNYSFNNGSDFTILAEEDIIVSDDILEYFGRAKRVYTPSDVLGICSHTYNLAGTQDELRLERRFEVLVWGTWKESWEHHIRDTWDHDYSTGLANGAEAGWDWNLSRLAKSVNPFVHPGVSRSCHIGELEGVHTTPEMYPATVAATFEEHR